MLRIGSNQHRVGRTEGPSRPFIEVSAKGMLYEEGVGPEIAYAALSALARKVNCSASPSFRSGIGETYTFDVGGCDSDTCGALKDNGAIECPLVEMTVEIIDKVAERTITIGGGDPKTSYLYYKASAVVLRNTVDTAAQ